MQLQNKSKINEMLQNMPSSWQEQYDIGRVLLFDACDIELPEIPMATDALQLIGITAGGRASKDTPIGPYKVPDEVRQEAMLGLTLSFEQNYGSWYFIGLARAIQLATVPGVSKTTLTRMNNYFRRHMKDQQSKNFGSIKNPTKGYMAWLNWGGDSGKIWCQEFSGR